MVYTFLTQTGNDLFNETWTEGNLYAIQGVVEMFGNLACILISVVGFGIVIFSIIKNALSGLYVVAPNIWDKVDELKEGVKTGVTNATGGNDTAKKLGGVFVWLLNFLPNVKELTDFSDDEAETIDKKQYFLKAIPLLIAQIFIGMMIFYGYPAKIANFIGTGATHVMSSVLNNVDPTTLVSSISDKFTVYTLSTDGSPLKIDKHINKVTQEMISVLVTKQNDIKKDSAQNVAYEIERIVSSAFTLDDVQSVLGAEEGYNVSYACSMQTGQPAPSNSAYTLVSEGNTIYKAVANNGTVSFFYYIPTSVLNTGSTKADANEYLVCRVTATPTAVSTATAAELIVCGSVNGVPINNVGGGYKITTNITSGSGINDITGPLGRSVNVYLISDKNEVVMTIPATLDTASITSTNNAPIQLSFAGTLDETLVKLVGPNANRQITVGNVTYTIKYMRVGLVGEWKKTFEDKSNVTTLRVPELRIRLGSSEGVKYLISTWTDAGIDNCTGTNINSSNIADMLQKTNSTGSNSTTPDPTAAVTATPTPDPGTGAGTTGQ